MSTQSSRSEWMVALVLVACVVLVAFWAIASRLAARPFAALRLQASDFERFQPFDAQWNIRRVHVKATPTEPTVVGYEVRQRASADPGAGGIREAPVLVRIVHGYNMVDCMRIKRYRVELRADTRRQPFDGGSQRQGFDQLPIQLWRLTSPSHERSFWATTMLRTSDFSATDVDTRDMAFPRIGTPDDPAWAPSGLRWRSLRNPIRNARLFLRARWNASRADVLTFLRLRQPAWADDTLLTMVSDIRMHVPEGSEKDAKDFVLEVHKMFYDQLRQFQASRPRVMVPER